MLGCRSTLAPTAGQTATFHPTFVTIAIGANDIVRGRACMSGTRSTHSAPLHPSTEAYDAWAAEMARVLSSPCAK